MIENMNNMEDIMTKIYDSFNAFTNRPIIMVDNATFFTYGSILITTTVLAVATIYDEDNPVDNENGYEEKEESASVLLNSMNLSSINEMSPFSTNQQEEEEKEREQEMNQNIGGNKRRKQKRTIKKRKN